MYFLRYVMSRIVVFWLSIAILVYGWFSNPQLVNTGFGASEALVKNLTSWRRPAKPKRWPCTFCTRAT